MKIYLLVLAAIMSLKAVEGCDNDMGCAFTFGQVGNCDRRLEDKGMHNLQLNITHLLNKKVYNCPYTT